MTKEKLRREHILADYLVLKREETGCLTSWFLSYFVPFMLIAVMSTAIVCMAELWTPIPIGICALFFLLSLGALLWYLRKRRVIAAEKKAFADGGYTVTIETLVEVKEETVASYRSRRHVSYADFLHFPSRKWRIPSRCYAWSDTYKMGCTGISNTSLAGDTFYVVAQADTKEIRVAYNTKFFEYQGI